MKKIIFSIFAIAVSVSLFAQDPSATQITLNSEDGNSNSLTLMEKTTFAPIYDATSTAFTGTLANTHNVNVYATYNTNKISIYKAKTLINVPMVVVTNADVATKQHYTLSFTVSKGRIMKLYDVVLDSMIYMNNGTSYAFEVTTANCPSYVANTHTTISDRFIIEPQFVPSTDPLQVCSDYDAIRIVTNPFTRKVKDYNRFPLITFACENSDIISYHCYDPTQDHEDFLKMLEPFGRPVFCTEYMARTRGCTFESTLPLLREHKVAAFNFGLVNGATQCHYDWNQLIEGKKIPWPEEPALWFHDILLPDGTPWDEKETDWLKDFLRCR